ncbi:zinc finger protein Pegasus-like [Dreissena polymorpha]|uniref:C2H2-type domain-containing protein n=1 Tax=Dreissena polymorpha TaxID=45954 RepID=A0A9D4LUD9_DREPO|nr:zinc finger protein Pegasus-like [Dreissena polymorpha]KAH3864231.1 hypothetical protein DPMN_027247 [Dreissena polymorpha]
MASHQEQSDLDRIRAELEHVKLENARLKLESEITGIERELDSDPEVGVEEDPCIDFNVGRIIRKRTAPEPVMAPKKPHLAVEQACSSWMGNEVSCDRPLETAAPDHSSMRRQVPTMVGCNVQTQTDEPRVNKCDVCDITFGNQAMMFVHKGCHCVDNPMRCNVCGETRHDAMGFYIHITMGHTAK